MTKTQLSILFALMGCGLVLGSALAGSDLVNSAKAQAEARRAEVDLQARQAQLDLEMYQRELRQAELDAREKALLQQLATKQSVLVELSRKRQADLEREIMLIRIGSLSLTGLLAVGGSVSLAVVIRHFSIRRDKKSLLERGSVQAYAAARMKGLEREQPIEVRRGYVLEVGVFETLPSGFRGALIRLKKLGPTRPVTFEISVYAEDMDVEPDWIQEYIYVPDNNTNVITFELTPRLIGQKEIRVEFYHQRHWLGQIRFEVEVVKAPELVQA